MNLANFTPQIRHLRDMKNVIFDKEWLQTAPDLELYYLYRDLAETPEDKNILLTQKLRYDITVMPFKILGKEFVKTAGHKHSTVSKTDLTYPEIYEVLDGRAIFLLQKLENDIILDVYAIKAQKNDKIIIPPNYDHTIINISPMELKIANYISRDCQNIYTTIEKNQGMCYFAVENGSQEIKWIKNNNYNSAPKLEFKETERLTNKFKITKSDSIYNLINDPVKLDFLQNPQNYNWN